WGSIVLLLAATGYLWCLAVWFISLNTIQWAVFRVRTWTEHSGLGMGQTHRLRATWWERFVFLPTNTWCHYEHHESAATPFYLLPALRERLEHSPKPISLGELFDLFGAMPACATGEVPSGRPAAAVTVWLDARPVATDTDIPDRRVR